MALLLASCVWAQAPPERLFNARVDPEQGRKLWSANCAVCHGDEGKGSRGPGLSSIQVVVCAAVLELAAGK